VVGSAYGNCADSTGDGSIAAAEDEHQDMAGGTLCKSVCGDLDNGGSAPWCYTKYNEDDSWGYCGCPGGVPPLTRPVPPPPTPRHAALPLLRLCAVVSLAHSSAPARLLTAHPRQTCRAASHLSPRTQARRSLARLAQHIRLAPLVKVCAEISMLRDPLATQTKLPASGATVLEPPQILHQAALKRCAGNMMIGILRKRRVAMRTRLAGRTPATALQKWRHVMNQLKSALNRCAGNMMIGRTR
jgi:hypothetical protein